MSSGFAAVATSSACLTSSCAVQMGYNLLYGLQKASYDADCSLFLNILKEEVKVLASNMNGLACSKCHFASQSLRNG